MQVLHRFLLRDEWGGYVRFGVASKHTTPITPVHETLPDQADGIVLQSVPGKKNELTVAPGIASASTALSSLRRNPGVQKARVTNHTRV